MGIRSLFRSTPMAADQAFIRGLEKSKKAGEVKTKYLEKVLVHVRMSSQKLDASGLKSVLNASTQIAGLLEGLKKQTAENYNTVDPRLLQVCDSNIKILKQALDAVKLTPQALTERLDSVNNRMRLGCDRLHPTIEILKDKLIKRRSETIALIERLPEQAKTKALDIIQASTVDLSQFSHNSDLTISLFPSEIKYEDGRHGSEVKHTVYAWGRGKWIEIGQNLKACKAIENNISTCTKLLENVEQLKTLEFNKIGVPKLSQDQLVIYNLGSNNRQSKA